MKITQGAVVLASLVMVVGCGDAIGGRMVVRNDSERVSVIRLVAADGRVTDVDVPAGASRVIPPPPYLPRQLVAFDARCSEMLIMSFDSGERPFDAGGTLTLHPPELASFTPEVTPDGRETAEHSRRCKDVPTPQVEPD